MATHLFHLHFLNESLCSLIAVCALRLDKWLHNSLKRPAFVFLRTIGNLTWRGLNCCRPHSKPLFISARISSSPIEDFWKFQSVLGQFVTDDKETCDSIHFWQITTSPIKRVISNPRYIGVQRCVCRSEQVTSWSWTDCAGLMEKFMNS